MKKVAFLHGFLGSPGDMEPLYIDGDYNESIDLRTLLFEKEPFQKLSQCLEDFDVLVGYSFGGRLLGELKNRNEFNDKTWVLISSRHSPYSKDELAEREVFRNKLGRLVQTDLQKFYEYWNQLSLFSGHLMSDFRDEYSTSYKPWTEEEMVKYLLDFFNSKQFVPQQDKNVHYIYGENDLKYSVEALKLKDLFTIHELKNVGHRAPFENVEGFKKLLKNISGVTK